MKKEWKEEERKLDERDRDRDRESTRADILSNYRVVERLQFNRAQHNERHAHTLVGCNTEAVYFYSHTHRVSSRTVRTTSNIHIREQ